MNDKILLMMKLLQSELLPAIDIEKIEKSGEATLDTLKGLSFEDAVSKIANSVVDFTFRLFLAILVFYLGKLIINRLYKGVRNLMLRRNVDASLTTFILSLIRITLYFILIIIVIGLLGIETSSFIALFASAGVAIGMALSGTLQNFAGGVLILLLKPYKVGNYIEAQGYAGTVKDINIFNTVINTPDNKSIIIPNGGLSTSSINNFSIERYRRVDWTVSLSYSTDFSKAKEAILEILSTDSRVVKQYLEDDLLERKNQELENDKEKLEALTNQNGSEEEIKDLRKKIELESSETSQNIENGDVKGESSHSWWYRLWHRNKLRRETVQQKLSEGLNINLGLPIKVDRSPFVGLNQMGDSSINITVRAWTPTEMYWGLYFEMNERFFSELPKKGFEFPFPQMDVHLSRETIS